ncbi:apolipo protein O-domain-containing protein [Panaeolus papilionaceus]|nr:apolipo protein O-domain-containing protein [Panaeolus papilionaceus]
MFRTASRLLSIYPTPDPEILLVESPSTLEQQIGVARRQVEQTYANAHSELQRWVSKWIGVEHAVENRVKAIISPDESLTPGLLYVGVATLSGSILARNRMLLTRFIAPPLFLLVSANYVLPKTTANLSSYLGSIEEKYFPTFAHKHDVAKAHSAMAWEQLKESTQKGRESLNNGALFAVDKFQESTGLKLRETLGWTKECVADGKQQVEKVAEVVQAVVEEKVEQAERKLGELEVKAEKKVEEGKRLV